MMAELANRYELRNRYVFTGKLIMLTAFHIGGGVGRMTASSSDSPVVLTPEEIPFIPGSSFKGVLRSTIEKLVPMLPGNWFSCGLIQLSDEDAKEAQDQGRRICPTAWSGDIAQEKRKNPGRAEQILEKARERLCATCQLFGSPFVASRVNINDLYMPLREWSSVIEVRDGVAIDRDSEKAKDRLKYDFEVVPSGAEFDLEITLENATTQDLQLLSVGLSEFIHRFGTIGGKRSRGLGACQLEHLHVSALELIDIDEQKRNQRLRDYLLERKFSREEDDGQVFLNEYISQIFKSASQ
jgi:CRISPR-associated RAMP protein (TIGR02581 family)